MHTETPTSPRTSRKLFTSVLAGQNSFPVKNVSLFKGEPAVFFSSEEIEVLAKPFKFALVGKFSFQSRPPMAKIRKFLTSLGLKSILSVGLLNDSSILINLGAEDDYTRLLVRALWNIEGTVMKLLKWSPSFNPSEDSPIVPVWVGFPGLPVHFYNRTALFSISKAVGNPLKTDESTALLNRPSVARVCVEVDVSKAWPKRIWIGEEKKGFWQEVYVENPPLYCAFCKTLGHAEDGCFKLHPSLLADLKKKKEEGMEAKNREEETRKKKGKVIVLPSVANKIFRPKMIGTSMLAVQKGELAEPSQPPKPMAVQTVVPTGITLTPFPDPNRIKMKEKEKARTESGSHEKDISGDFVLVAHQPLYSKENISTPAEGIFSQTAEYQPLDLAFLGSFPQTNENNFQPLDQTLDAEGVKKAQSVKIDIVKDGVSEVPQVICSGKKLGPSDCSQSNGHDLVLGDSQPQLNKDVVLLAMEKVNGDCGSMLLGEGRKLEAETGTFADKEEKKAKLLETFQKNKIQLQDFPIDYQTLDLSGEEERSGQRGKNLMEEKDCATVEPDIFAIKNLLPAIEEFKLVGGKQSGSFFQNPIKFGPSDRYALILKKIKEKSGQKENDSVGSVDGKKWIGPGNLGLEFFHGPNHSGTQKLNAKSLAYQPIGLQVHGGLDRKGAVFGLEEFEFSAGQMGKVVGLAGPTILNKEMAEGLNMAGGMENLIGPENAMLPGSSISSGPIILEEIFGPNAIIPIKPNGEIVVAQARNNYLHLLDPLLQFIQGRGIPISSSLRTAIYNFLLQSGPPIIALSKENFNWDVFRTYFFRHLKNSKIRMTWNLRCTLEQFFQCLETSLLEKNVKIAIDLSCNSSLPQNVEFIKSYPLPNSQNSIPLVQESFPINIQPVLELSSTQSLSSVAVEKRVSFRDALQKRLQKEKEREHAQPRAPALETEELGPCAFIQPQHSQFDKFMESGDLLESEVGDNFDFEDFDNFGDYNGGAVFPGNDSDESWDSEDSGTKQFLKGKWKQDYTMRASSSRKSL